jgi:hypothetical protein
MMRKMNQETGLMLRKSSATNTNRLRQKMRISKLRLQNSFKTKPLKILKTKKLNKLKSHKRNLKKKRKRKT